MTYAPFNIRVKLKLAAAVGGLAVLSACATPVAPPPPPPPPPPAAVETVPYRPLPPPLAAYSMDIPRKDASGQRITVNTGLNTDEAIWHFRSGWNVAALNCVLPNEEVITSAYGDMLTAETQRLAAANAAIESRFRDDAARARREAGQSANADQARRTAIRTREAYLTAVYNYFSTPPARREFCNAALQVANEYTAARPQDFPAFAINGLARYEAAFDRFFTEYETYERESAAWDAKWGAMFGPSQPGWVALYGNGPAPTAQPNSQMAGQVIDPATGVAVPVIPVDEMVSSTPVVQPVAGQ